MQTKALFFLKTATLFSFLLQFFVSQTALALSCEVAMTPIGNMGDYEIVIDPESPSELLLTANYGEGEDSLNEIQIHTLDANGIYIGGTEVLASNYIGTSRRNGPEFMYHPDHGVGITYTGPMGMHATWRRNNTWGYNVFGTPIAGEPEALPGTQYGLYPGLFPMGVKTRMELDLFSPRIFIGKVDSQVQTDVVSLFAESRLSFFTGVIHPSLENTMVVALGGRRGAALFQVALDGKGGIDYSQSSQLTPFRTELSRVDELAIAYHPANGNLVIMVIGDRYTQVWENSGEGLTLIAQSELTFKPDHLRMIVGDKGVYGHFYDRSATNFDQWLIEYEATPNEPYMFADEIRSVELVWIPSGRLALFSLDREADALRVCRF